MLFTELGPDGTPKGDEDSTELQKMLTSCMINRQAMVRNTSLQVLFYLCSQPDLYAILMSCVLNFPSVLQCCVAGVLIGIPISIRRKSYAPFAILGVLGTARMRSASVASIHIADGVLMISPCDRFVH